MMVIDTPGQVLARYETAVNGLTELQRLPHSALTARPAYRDMTPADLIEHLREVRSDLEERYVLAVFSAVEAALRSDALWRLSKGKRSRPETAALRDAVEPATRARFRLDDLLYCWRDLVDDRSPFSELIRINRRRHWLAHGKYFQDRSGVGDLEPADVLFHWEQAMAAAQAVAADFPRDDHGV